jgi:hypothetical protein
VRSFQAVWRTRYEQHVIAVEQGSAGKDGLFFLRAAGDEACDHVMDAGSGHRHSSRALYSFVATACPTVGPKLRGHRVVRK